MALTNAEKQRRYRSRHLGVGGKREPLQCLIAIPAKRNLERLACHYGYSMTTMLEVLVNERTVELLRKLNDWEQKNFYAQVPTYRATKKTADCDWEQKSFYSRVKSSRIAQAFNELDKEEACAEQKGRQL